MGRYDLMLYKLVNIYGIFLRGHAHMTTPICRKILSLAPSPKIPSYATAFKLASARRLLMA